MENNKENFQNEVKNAINIICKYGILDKMDNVCTYETFMTRVEDELSRNNNYLLKNGKSTIFMGDIDNLGKLNIKYKNQNRVDSALSNLIKNIRKVLRDNGIPSYDIGKMGDEIYIFIPHSIDENKKSNILNELNNTKAYINQDSKNGKMEDYITISFGASKIGISGLEDSKSKAEDLMMETKEKRKIKKMQLLLNSSSKKKIIMKELLDDIDVQLRIDTDKLKKEQYEIYKKNKYNSIKKILRKIDKITEKDKSLKDIIEKEKREPSFLENVTLKEENKKYEKKYPNIKILPRDLEVLQIADILQHSVIPGVQRKSTFLNKNLKELLNKDIKSQLQVFSNTDISTLEIGKIKYMNDNYGHSFCDNQIYNLMQVVINKLDELGITKNADIIEENISTYYILINSNTSKEKWNEFEKKLSELENKQILSVTISKPKKLLAKKQRENGEIKKEKNRIEYNGEQEEKSIKDIVINNFQKIIDENKKENEIKKIEKKIMDTDLIDYVVEKSMKTMCVDLKNVKQIRQLGRNRQQKEAEKIEKERK